MLLQPLGPEGSRRCRLRLWNAYDDVPFHEEYRTVAPDAILIADGVFLGVPALRDHWDLTIWVDVDWDTMLRRAKHRDAVWGGPQAAILEKYRRGWVPRHRLYETVARPRELADIVVDNRDPDHPFVVRARETVKLGTA